MRYGYARVSTPDQRLDLQLDALTAAGCERTFRDVVSGARTERPGLSACLEALRPGDVFTVWKLDRLGRSVRHLIDTVEDLKTRGVGFHSLQEQMDTTTPGGTLIFTMFAALAQFERDLVRERVSAGLAAARARGRRGGRKPALDARRTAQAIALAREGTTRIVDIANTLGVSESTIYRALRLRTALRHAAD